MSSSDDDGVPLATLASARRAAPPTKAPSKPSLGGTGDGAKPVAQPTRPPSSDDAENRSIAQLAADRKRRAELHAMASAPVKKPAPPTSKYPTFQKQQPAKIESDDEPISALKRKPESKPSEPIKKKRVNEKMLKKLKRDPLAALKRKAKKPVVTPESDDDAWMTPKSKPPTQAPKKKPKSESSDSDEPIASIKAAPSHKKKVVKDLQFKKPKSESSESDGDEPIASIKAAPARKKAPAKPKVKKERRFPELKLPDIPLFRWWEEEELPEGIQWRRQLEHQGPVFPPPYKPINVGILYSGTLVKLGPQAEEAAGFYASMMDATQYSTKKMFNDNFFNDFTTVMKKEASLHPEYAERYNKIRQFEKIDFTPMYQYYQREKEMRKNMTPEEKYEERKIKHAVMIKYGFVKIDGRVEQVGNFRVEPPGLFRGRGEHPKQGCIKHRLQPEDITINISKGSPVPPAPEGHRWKAVTHDNTVSFLATWKENINGDNKYIMFAASSSIKGKSDLAKFEKARELKKHVGRIRRAYTQQISSGSPIEKQRATALYLIDTLALRVGGEKDTEEEADTVGCCSLRVEHVTLIQPNKLELDFLGKDSMRYHNTVAVTKDVFRNIGLFIKSKKKEDQLFDLLTTSNLNKYLNEFLPGLTAKVFRTFNASITLYQQLASFDPSDKTEAELLQLYNRSNKEVAVLCNHQRTVPKGFAVQREKLDLKVKAMMDDIDLARRELAAVKKGNHATWEKINKERVDVDHKRAIANWEEKLVRLEAAGKTDKVKVKEREELLEKKPQPKTHQMPNEAAAKTRLSKLEARLHSAEKDIETKDDLKEISLTTSKINYMDPRITIAWCKLVSRKPEGSPTKKARKDGSGKQAVVWRGMTEEQRQAKHEELYDMKRYDFLQNKIFSKTLRNKFPWSMDVDHTWVF